MCKSYLSTKYSLASTCRSRLASSGPSWLRSHLENSMLRQLEAGTFVIGPHASRKRAGPRWFVMGSLETTVIQPLKNQLKKFPLAIISHNSCLKNQQTDGEAKRVAHWPRKSTFFRTFLAAAQRPEPSWLTKCWGNVVRQRSLSKRRVSKKGFTTSLNAVMSRGLSLANWWFFWLMAEGNLQDTNWVLLYKTYINLPKLTFVLNQSNIIQWTLVQPCEKQLVEVMRWCCEASADMGWEVLVFTCSPTEEVSPL